MFENIMKIFKKRNKKEEKVATSSKDAAKERLHLVLMQDRANVSADFLELMKQEIIDVIKKYIDVDESAIDVRLTNKENEDGTNGAPALYANIPILNIKNDARKVDAKSEEKPKTENKNTEKNDETKKQEVKKKKEEKDLDSDKEKKVEPKKEKKKEIEKQNKEADENKKEIKEEIVEETENNKVAKEKIS